MSKEVFSNDDFSIDEYWGGKEKGFCLQMTMIDGKYAVDENLIGAVQVDIKNAIQLYNELGAWIQGECIRRQQILRKQIEDKKEFEKTVFREIADLGKELMYNKPISADFILQFTPASED